MEDGEEEEEQEEEEEEGKRSSLRKKFDATCQPVNTRDTQRGQSMTSRESRERGGASSPAPRSSYRAFLVFQRPALWVYHPQIWIDHLNFPIPWSMTWSIDDE